MWGVVGLETEDAMHVYNSSCDSEFVSVNPYFREPTQVALHVSQWRLTATVCAEEKRWSVALEATAVSVHKGQSGTSIRCIHSMGEVCMYVHM